MAVVRHTFCVAVVSVFVAWLLPAAEVMHVVENAFLRRVLATDGGVLHTVEITNKRSGVTVRPEASHEFSLRLSQGSNPSATSCVVTAQDFQVMKVDEPDGRLIVTLNNAALGLTVQVAYERSEADFWLRKRLTVTSDEPVTLERIDVEALALPDDAYQPYTTRDITARGAARWSPGLGQPLYGKRSATFWGVEFPAADNRVQEGVLSAGYLHGRTLASGIPYVSYAAVLGVADDAAYVRDAFFEYIERIRARPLRLQIQFNSWFDAGGGVSKSNFHESVSTVNRELVEVRGCRPLSAYVIDDGWQDTRADWSDRLWPVNSKFDADFGSTLADVRAARSRLGLWLSPGCLFGASAQVSRLRAQGYEALDDWMSMAGPRYMQALEDRMVELTRQGVAFFKLDGIFGHLNVRNFELHGERYGLPCMSPLLAEGMKGNDARLNDSRYDELKIMYLTAGAERLIRIFKRQAEIDPEVFLLISNGAWLSPWWLMYVDAVWMINAGDAAGGSSRTAELVYRDERYHAFAVRENAQFPLCSVFNHEPKKLDSRETKESFRKYLYLHLSRGSGFVELYIKPAKLAPYDWDVLAEGLQWAYAVFPTFGRVRMHGGNPGAGDVYGYTAWCDGQGYVSVHNPAEEARRYVVTLDRSFGVPSDHATYWVSSPLEGSVRGLPERVSEGAVLTFELAPREIRVVNFTAEPQTWDSLKRLQSRTAEACGPSPEPDIKPVPDHALLGSWTYVWGGQTYTRTFGRDGRCRLLRGNDVVWMKGFAPSGKDALVVEGGLQHEAQTDGTMLIEGRYHARRTPR